MSPPLVALKQVAALDAKIFQLKKKCEDIPKQIQRQEQILEAARRELAAKQAELKDQRVKAELKEKEFQDAEQTVIKLRKQINEARSNKEFQALQHEILSKEADNARLEDAVLTQMQKVDRVQEERAALGQKARDAEAELTEHRAGLDTQHEQTVAEIERLTKQRSAAARSVPEDIFAKYERLIQRRGQTAMVAVVNGTCQGCFMNMRPETMAQLKRGTELVACHSCGRILYLEE